jgi:hypothetical protein
LYKGGPGRDAGRRCAGRPSRHLGGRPWRRRRGRGIRYEDATSALLRSAMHPDAGFFGKCVTANPPRLSSCPLVLLNRGLPPAIERTNKPPTSQVRGGRGEQSARGGAASVVGGSSVAGGGGDVAVVTGFTSGVCTDPLQGRWPNAASHSPSFNALSLAQRSSCCSILTLTSNVFLSSSSYFYSLCSVDIPLSWPMPCLCLIDP